MHRTPIYVGKRSFPFWSVCASLSLLPWPLFFSPTVMCAFLLLFFSYMILCIQFHIDCHCLHWHQSIYRQTPVVLAGIYLPNHHLHTQCWSFFDQLHKSWVGFTSGNPPFITGMLCGKKDLGNLPSVWPWWFPMAKWSGLVVLLMPTNSITVRSLTTFHFCWWCHLSSCFNSSKLASSFICLGLKSFQ